MCHRLPRPLACVYAAVAARRALGSAEKYARGEMKQRAVLCGEQVEVEVQQSSKTVWIARGEYTTRVKRHSRRCGKGLG
jgi:hypothetical protein